MDTIYSFQASDGIEYEATTAQLKEWLHTGRIRLDDKVIDFLNGQPYRVRDILGIGGQEVAPAMAGGYSNYPRGPVTGAFPDDLKGFNFGACFMPIFWGLSHKKYVLLLSYVVGFAPVAILKFPIVLAFHLWAGANGNKWAWESGRFTSVEDCKACQKIWTNWVFAFVLVLAAVIAWLYFIFYSARSR